MANTYTTGTSLNFKQAVKMVLDYSRIEAEQNHKRIENLVNNLTTDTTITYGTVVADFDSDVVASYATTNNLTYTTASKLTTAKATELSIKLSRAQAKKEHDALNDAIDVTDEWIKSNFDSDTVQIYTDRFEENFKLKPTVLLDILQNDETLGTTFEGYTATLNENTITISKDGADSYTFTVAEDSLTATGTIDDDTYIIDYKAKTVTKVEE